MCINPFENYSDVEKTELLQDYIDLLTTWYCVNYDMFLKLNSNNILKRKFLKVCVPIWYDWLDLLKVFNGDSNLLNIIQDNMEKVAFDYPLFYLQCAVCGALDCYGEVLSVKKIVSRWSQILLNLS